MASYWQVRKNLKRALNLQCAEVAAGYIVHRKNLKKSENFAAEL